MKRFSTKVLTSILVLVMLVGSMSMQVFASDIQVSFNGEIIQFDQPLRTASDILLTPIRPVSDAIGAELRWNAANRTATIILGNTGVAVAMDNPVMVVRNMTTTEEVRVNLPINGRLYNGIPFIPIEAIVTALGLNVSWDTTNRVVEITTDNIVFSDRQITAISRGFNHTMMIKSDGSLWGFGNNYVGQLGDGTTNHTFNGGAIRVLDDASYVSAGNAYTMAIRSDGSLWAWGNNGYGQLGDGTTTQRLNPIMIMDNVVSVSTSSSCHGGQSHTMAIRSDGSLWAWGSNDHGQLGDGTTVSRLSPVRVMDNVVHVSVGERYTLAVRSDGSLWSWGNNHSGQLGRGYADPFYDWRLLHPTNEWIMFGILPSANPHPIKILESVVSVSAGPNHAMAIRSDGSLWGWGASGRVGDNTTHNRYSPVRVMDGIVSVSTAGVYTMALDAEGNLWMWGTHTVTNSQGVQERVPTAPRMRMDNVAAFSAGAQQLWLVRNDDSIWVLLVSGTNIDEFVNRSSYVFQ